MRQKAGDSGNSRVELSIKHLIVINVSHCSPSYYSQAASLLLCCLCYFAIYWYKGKYKQYFLNERSTPPHLSSWLDIREEFQIVFGSIFLSLSVHHRTKWMGSEIQCDHTFRRGPISHNTCVDGPWCFYYLRFYFLDTRRHNYLSFVCCYSNAFLVLSLCDAHKIPITNPGNCTQLRKLDPSIIWYIRNEITTEKWPGYHSVL